MMLRTILLYSARCTQSVILRSNDTYTALHRQLRVQVDQFHRRLDKC